MRTAVNLLQVYWKKYCQITIPFVISIGRWIAQSRGGESSGQLLRHLDPSAKYFAVFDAVSGFHQVPLHPESSKLLNITTQMGNYRYTVLAQGLCASQDLFNIITKGETQLDPTFKIIKNVDDFCLFGSSLKDLENCCKHRGVLNIYCGN